MRSRNLENIPDGVCRCSVCFITKPNTEFPYYANQFYNKGLEHPWTGKRKRVNTNCYECASIKAKERTAIRKKFKGMKPPSYGTPCQCCNKPVYASKETIPEGIDGTWVWQLDHCHETGEFRGWLCKKCNTGLGNLGDNLESLERAVTYLRNQTHK